MNSSDEPSLRESPAPQLIARHVLRHYCPFCSRSWAHRDAAGRHLRRCFKNPDARSCKTCLAYQPPEASDYATNYPGCGEGCDGGHSLSDGLRIGCSDWEPLPTSNRKDGATPQNNDPSNAK